AARILPSPGARSDIDRLAAGTDFGRRIRNESHEASPAPLPGPLHIVQPLSARAREDADVPVPPGIGGKGTRRAKPGGDDFVCTLRTGHFLVAAEPPGSRGHLLPSARFGKRHQVPTTV